MKSDERETSGNLSMTDRLAGGTWRFYSDDPVMITKLRKVAKAQSAGHGGYFFDVSAECVVFRRAMSAEQKAKQAGNLKPDKHQDVGQKETRQTVDAV